MTSFFTLRIGKIKRNTTNNMKRESFNINTLAAVAISLLKVNAEALFSMGRFSLTMGPNRIVWLQMHLSKQIAMEKGKKIVKIYCQRLIWKS